MNYWIGRIDTDNAPKSQFIVEYINAVLAYNETDADALQAQAILYNKIIAAQYFTNTLGELSNGDPGTDAYQASIDVLTVIDETESSIDSSKALTAGYIETLQAKNTDASYHNIIRHALNNATSLDNLGFNLNQSYDFSQQVTPSTALPDLVDDATLVASAKEYASGCIYAHSGGNYGENLFAGTGSGYTIEHAVNSWASEVADYDYNQNTCAAGKVCGHYTQIVWADTSNVGCALQVCAPLKYPDGSTVFGDVSSHYIVCQYTPPGNFIGQKPY